MSLDDYESTPQHSFGDDIPRELYTTIMTPFKPSSVTKDNFDSDIHALLPNVEAILAFKAKELLRDWIPDSTACKFTTSLITRLQQYLFRLEQSRYQILLKYDDLDEIHKSSIHPAPQPPQCPPPAPLHDPSILALASSLADVLKGEGHELDSDTASRILTHLKTPPQADTLRVSQLEMDRKSLDSALDKALRRLSSLEVRARRAETELARSKASRLHSRSKSRSRHAPTKRAEQVDKLTARVQAMNARLGSQAASAAQWRERARLLEADSLAAVERHDLQRKDIMELRRQLRSMAKRLKAERETRETAQSKLEVARSAVGELRGRVNEVGKETEAELESIRSDYEKERRKMTAAARAYRRRVEELEGELARERRESRRDPPAPTAPSGDGMRRSLHSGRSRGSRAHSSTHHHATQPVYETHHQYDAIPPPATASHTTAWAPHATSRSADAATSTPQRAPPAASTMTVSVGQGDDMPPMISPPQPMPVPRAISPPTMHSEDVEAAYDPALLASAYQQIHSQRMDFDI